MEKSKEALKILISGESNAVKMYESFAAKAVEEGWNNIAVLLQALSQAEKIHIKNHRNALKEEFSVEPEEVELKTTLENLTTAIEGETEETRKLYPRMLRFIKRDTKSEYGKVARLTMTWARKVEKEHARLLKKARKALGNGQDLEIKRIYLCQVCGNIVLDDLGDGICDVCGHDDQFFTQVNGVR